MWQYVIILYISTHLWILEKIKCIISTKILCCFLTLIIINVSWAAYYYDFWRSCDTEDCSNDAENTALITEINYSLIDIHIENSWFTLE